MIFFNVKLLLSILIFISSVYSKYYKSYGISELQNYLQYSNENFSFIIDINLGFQDINLFINSTKIYSKFVHNNKSNDHIFIDTLLEKCVFIATTPFETTPFSLTTVSYTHLTLPTILLV